MPNPDQTEKTEFSASPSDLDQQIQKFLYASQIERENMWGSQRNFRFPYRF